jgi:hypothetical protein
VGAIVIFGLVAKMRVSDNKRSKRDPTRVGEKNAQT